MQGKWLLATALTLVCAVGARADTLTLTSTTINATPNMNQFNGGSLSGASYTNANTQNIANGVNNPVMVGNALTALGYDFPTSIQKVGNAIQPTGLTNAVAVFALTGTATAVGTTLTASFNCGTL